MERGVPAISVGILLILAAAGVAVSLPEPKLVTSITKNDVYSLGEITKQNWYGLGYLKSGDFIRGELKVDEYPAGGYLNLSVDLYSGEITVASKLETYGRITGVGTVGFKYDVASDGSYWLVVYGEMGGGAKYDLAVQSFDGPQPSRLSYVVLGAGTVVTLVGVYLYLKESLRRRRRLIEEMLGV